MTPTPEEIQAAKRGHPDTITAHKVLVDALTLVEDRLASMSLCKACGDGLVMVFGGQVVSEMLEDDEDPHCCPPECGGCSCHIAPPCGHCTDHVPDRMKEN